MPDRQIQEWRWGIAAIITMVLIVVFAVMTIFAMITVGRWLIEDAPFEVVLRGGGAWLVAWMILNLWSLALQKLN
jgi:hypothetical protein